MKVKKPTEQRVYTVEKDVIMPPKRYKHAIYPFGTMQKNDSFVFDMLNYKRISSAATVYKRRNGGNFAVRAISDTEGRCWRVA